MTEVQGMYLQEIRTIARTKGLQGWEVPVGVILEPEPFTREAGLLTLTFKQCRPKLEQKYRTVLEKLYQEVNAAQMERYENYYCYNSFNARNKSFWGQK